MANSKITEKNFIQDHLVSLVRGQKKVKYKEGQFVYSYQNPTEKRPINRIRISEDGDYDHKYRLTLAGNDGFPKNSNWIDEKSLSLKPIKK